MITWISNIRKKLSREETFAVPANRKIFTFRGQKLSRMSCVMKNFAGINFHGEPLSKDFTAIKKAKI